MKRKEDEEEVAEAEEEEKQKEKTLFCKTNFTINSLRNKQSPTCMPKWDTPTQMHSHMIQHEKRF